MGYYYGMIPLFIVLFYSVATIIALLLVWPWESCQLLSATRSWYRENHIILAEICTVVCLATASSSLCGKYWANDYTSDVSYLIRNTRPLCVICKLDIAASSAILVAHALGHHDICHRIYSRSIRIRNGLRIYGQQLWLCLYIMLQESPQDFERRKDAESQRESVLGNNSTRYSFPAHSSKDGTTPTEATQAPRDPEATEVEEIPRQHNVPAGAKRIQVRRIASTYRSVHEEVRAMHARLRWSAVRYAFHLQKLPLEDLSFTVAVRAQAYHPEASCAEAPQIHPIFQFPSKIAAAHAASSDLSPVIMEMIDSTAPNSQHSATKPNFLPVQWSPARQDSMLPPLLQLPGTINEICVKALPDTGSSSNIINKAFLDHLGASVEIIALDDTVDKPLKAPDDEVIPCLGKVWLDWTFKDESTPHRLLFNIIENCSHQVIIGDGFLRESRTMEDHPRRLEYVMREDPNFLPGNLASEAQEERTVRRVVCGAINGQCVTASLDTGCQANLMSEQCANDLGLEIKPLPGGCQDLTYTNGRKGSTCGHVEADWSFDDSPHTMVKIVCYVLPKCIHSIILGDHFVYNEQPWTHHAESLSEQILDGAGDTGVVNFKPKWLFSKKPGTIPEIKIYEAFSC